MEATVKNEPIWKNWVPAVMVTCILKCQVRFKYFNLSEESNISQ